MQENAGARRLIELAEMLLNLQAIPGFAEPLGKLQTDDAEAAFGALEAAKMLRRSRVRFEFVLPSGVKGYDYDIEAHPENGPAVPIEAKSKLASTTRSEESITSTLKEAKKQLPNGRPGVIMVRVPREWEGDAFLLGQFTRAAEAVLRNSSRVAGIIGFTNVFSAGAGLHGSFHAAKDMWSKRPEFAAAPSWKLITSDVSDETDSWIRIRVILGQRANLGIMAAEAKKKLGLID